MPKPFDKKALVASMAGAPVVASPVREVPAHRTPVSERPSDVAPSSAMPVNDNEAPSASMQMAPAPKPKARVQAAPAEKRWNVWISEDLREALLDRVHVLGKVRGQRPSNRDITEEALIAWVKAADREIAKAQG